ncbi:class I SAM-dependent methyltransferase [Hyphomicrobium sp. MC1]|uniref:class I SAM-dependent methyltransferase n=1 Tax=Hyphomicrobium sp. (strain MC1) TaxID=717785 RepID=UPI000213D81F|nr:class I SAM-dependent methyltransferase [Hyphomicrobium sp. MC1]CCB65049.1 putative Methyltransferase [Hyphomicrobium sp. MC1]
MIHKCRFCGAPLRTTFADLGMAPVANDFVSLEHALAMEPFYPLHAYVCRECFLVQLIDFRRADSLFTDEYAYFSSYSESWLEHARTYATAMIASEKLTNDSLVVELASNDGYLLQYFKREGVSVLGVEPTVNTARVALEKHGIESEVAFFGKETALRLRERGVQADVMAANNVLAHVPDINDFVSGFSIVLRKGGVATVEFPHLLRQIENHQFDTIYHEHFSYLSFSIARRIFAAHEMRVYDVAELTTHGGSLRIFVCHDDDQTRPDTPAVAAMLELERVHGLGQLNTYERFAKDIVTIKCDLLDFLVKSKRAGKSVAAYGAPAKGNTLLNYCGVKADMIDFTVDRSPYKAGKLLPGSRIPILAPEAIAERKPDYVLILPWNLKDEIMQQMAHIRDWGGKFVTPIPDIRIYD